MFENAAQPRESICALNLFLLYRAGVLSDHLRYSLPRVTCALHHCQIPQSRPQKMFRGADRVRTTQRLPRVCRAQCIASSVFPAVRAALAVSFLASTPPFRRVTDSADLGRENIGNQRFPP